MLERADGLPKDQRFILGQRLANPVMDVLETLVKANEGIEMTRWIVRMARDSKLLAPKQFKPQQQRGVPCRQALDGADAFPKARSWRWKFPCHAVPGSGTSGMSRAVAGVFPTPVEKDKGRRRLVARAKAAFSNSDKAGATEMG